MGRSGTQTLARVVDRHLTALSRGDLGAAASVVAPASPAGTIRGAHGKDAVLASRREPRSIVRGHCLLRRWRGGDEVCSISRVGIETPEARL